MAFGVHGVTAASCSVFMYGRGVTPGDLHEDAAHPDGRRLARRLRAAREGASFRRLDVDDEAGALPIRRGPPHTRHGESV
jgi:hypothetical protein